ncbi:hypothetical protein EC957_002355 [Mortierella hygrophila]|uniref:Uncharacterized protein n=1 Tax=Mortierella hygrophila TaxID=979708 RepID=A0A9P6F4Y9_9FUNG|nr:hypothetical protein EC957_002355 [Mortierella hygrophila]
MQRMMGEVIRYFGLNWIPNWLVQNDLEVANSCRPQMVFLPHVPFRGTFCRTKTNSPSPRFVKEMYEKVGKAVAL